MKGNYKMRYTGRVFRPPSEARSLIVQVTYGCSHNRCCFCDMYKEKHFSVRPLEEIFEDFDMARRAYGDAPLRVFLADGDAFMLSTDKLISILDRINATMPNRERITCYASPGSIAAKSDSDLKLLAEHGISMVYMGLESGSDRVLSLMDKGHTAEQIVQAGLRVKSAGIALSVTAISGLGGRAMWQEHATQTAQALSKINPEYIGLLTLMVEQGTPLCDWIEQGSFELLTAEEVLRETAMLIENIDSPGSVFRMNHASNYLRLSGTLNADRDAMLEIIRRGLEGEARLKSENMRAL